MEITGSLERAAQWCKVADDFVATYGCPFLYAECRIYYGSVLAAKGRWADAERELAVGLRITAGACPGLHAKALIVDGTQFAPGGSYNGQTITGIGLTKAAAIYYRAESVYQTPTTDFPAHRVAILSSCSDLVGQP